MVVLLLVALVIECLVIRAFFGIVIAVATFVVQCAIIGWTISEIKHSQIVEERTK